MPDLNDVVRHVYLRIVVDQSTLAADLAAARAKLKAFEQDEKNSNRARSKDAQTVTDAIQKQNAALDENAAASSRAHQAATGNAQSVATQQKANTKAIQDNTKALNQQSVDQAKADAIRQKAQSDFIAQRDADNRAQQAQYEKNRVAAQTAADEKRRRDNEAAARIRRADNEAEARLVKLGLAAEEAEEKRAQAALKTEDVQDEIARRQEERARRQQHQADLDEARAAAVRAQSAGTVSTSASNSRAAGARAGTAEVRQADVEDAAAIAWDERRRRSRHQQQLDLLQIEALTARVRREEELALAATERRERALKKQNTGLKGLLTEFKQIGQALASAGFDANAPRETRLTRSVAAFDTAMGRNNLGYTGAAAQRRTSRSVVFDAIPAAVGELFSDPRKRNTAISKPLQVLFPGEAKKIEEANYNFARFSDRVLKFRAQLATAGSGGGYLDNIRNAVKELATSGPTFDAYRRGVANVRVEHAALRNSILEVHRANGQLDGNFGMWGRYKAAVKGFREGLDSSGNALTRFGRGIRGLRDETEKLGSGASALRRLRTTFFAFGSGASETFDRARRSLSAMREELRKTGTGSIPQRLGESFISLSDGVNRGAKNLTKHLLSIRTLIIGVIAALGPLGAILGSVGAAALGLAANLGSLTGVLFALPGLIGAAVSAFGVLATVMGPLTKVFSAFSDVTKQSATSQTTAAANAINLAQAQEKLNEARENAARRIQDYRAALQKLKFDEEGANLGVENAEQAYRRVLADPTATALDRKNALHAVEQAKFDKRDQTIEAGRTKEDAAKAEQKGVEGSDEVIAALEALTKAQRASTSGSEAAADAQDKLDAALAKLGPNTRKVVMATHDLADEWSDFQKRLSDRLFGPVVQDTGKFAGILESLEKFLGPVADALGELAHQAITLFSSKEWKSFFSEQGEANKQTVLDLGSAFLNIVDAFKNIIIAARPFTDWLTDAFKNLTEDFADWADGSAKAGKDSGLVMFLDDTEKRIKQLWPIIKNFASGFAGFWKALTQPVNGDADFTTKINDGLLGISKTFKRLGAQAQDPKGGFQQWLRDVGPLIRDTVKGVAAVAEFFGHLFADTENIDEARRILGELSETILPALSDFFKQLSESGLVDKILEGLGGFFTAINNFLDAGGVTGLSVFFTILSKIGVVLGYLTTQFPKLTAVFAGLSTVIAGLVAASLFARVFRLFTLVTGLAGLAKTVVGGGSVLGGIRNAITGKVDSLKDTALGKDAGVSAAQRNARNNRTPGSPKPDVDLSGTGGVESHLTRIERLLIEIKGHTATIAKCACKPGGRDGKGKDGKPGRSDSTRPSSSTRPSTSTRPFGGDPIREHPGTILADDGSGKPKQIHPGTTASPGAPTASKQTGFTTVSSGPVVSNGKTVVSNVDTVQDAVERQKSERAHPGNTASPGSRTGFTIVEDAVTRQQKQDAARPRQTGPLALPGRPQQYALPVGSIPVTPTRGSGGTFVSPDKPAKPVLVNTGSDYNVYTDADGKPITQSGEKPKKRRYTTVPNDVVQSFADDPSTRQTKRDKRAAEQAAAEEETRNRQARRDAVQQSRNERNANGTALGNTEANARNQINRPTPTVDTPDRPARRIPAGMGGFDPDLVASIVAEDERRATGGTTRPSRTKRFGAAIKNVFSRNRPTVADATPAPSRRDISTTPAPSTMPRPSTSGGFDPDLLGSIVAEDERREQERQRAAAGGSAARPSRTKKAFGKLWDFLKFPSSDEGSIPATGFGRGTRSRRDRTTTRPGGSTRPTTPRPSTRPGNGAGAAGATGATAVAGAADTGDDEDYLSDLNDVLSDYAPDDDDDDDRHRNRRDASTSGEPAADDPSHPNRRSGTGTPGTGTPGDPNNAQPGRRRRFGRRPRTPGTGRGRLGGLRNMFGRGGSGVRTGFGRVGGALSRGAGALSRGAGALGRAGGGLARGLAGGLAGLAISGGLALGGDYLINKFVGNDEDANSLSGGLNGVATGATLGATIGSFVPGIGTAIGAGIGGLAGGAYSLYKDKNLRNFVGDKLSGVGGLVKGAAGAIGGAASSAWGGIKSAGSAVKDIFTGGGGGPSAMLLGPLGGLLAKTDIGKSIFDSLNKFGGKIGDFFTKTIPGFFSKGVSGITDFFTKTLPSLPARAFHGFFFAVGRIGAFFTKDIPRFVTEAGRFIANGFEAGFHAFFFAVGRVGAFFTKDIPRFVGKAAKTITDMWDGFVKFITVTGPAAVASFFTETIPNAASDAWKFIVANLWDPFVGFIRSIPGFFTETIPQWFSAVNEWFGKNVTEPVTTFVTTTVPNFFTETVPHWFEEAPAWFGEHVVTPVTDFFTVSVPDFFTHTLPEAISKLPGYLYSNLVQPILDFFGGIAGHVGDFLKGSWDWAKGLFNSASADVKAGYNSDQKKMSGGLIAGVYQGIEDTAKVWATPGEWVVRKSKVDQPQGKRFLSDYNEGRIDPARFYAGLSQTVAPTAMSVVPADSAAFSGQVPSIVNHQVDNSLTYGDVIIHNPVREKSEYSLRRQLQIANIRHRR